MTSRVLLGIDVGGSKVAGVAVDAESDAVCAHSEVALNGQALHVQVADLARSLLAAVGTSRHHVAAVGVVAPGQVDAATGVIRMAVNLEASELAIGPLVADAIEAPCFVEHDARAVAAWLHATGHGADLAYVSVGTGVSAGVVVGGSLVRGADGLAGEIGHIVAEVDGRLCACGLRGCLEAVASGPAVARHAHDAIRGGRSSSMGPDPETADVYHAAEAGDPLAIEIVDRAAAHLARAVRGLSLAFGTSNITIGGGVTRAGRAFIAPLMAAIERERAASPLVRRALLSDRIEVLDDARPVGALGAAAVARLGIGLPATGDGGEVGTR